MTVLPSVQAAAANVLRSFFLGLGAPTPTETTSPPPQFVTGLDGPRINQDFIYWFERVAKRDAEMPSREDCPSFASPVMLTIEPALYFGYTNNVVNQDWVFWWEVHHRGEEIDNLQPIFPNILSLSDDDSSVPHVPLVAPASPVVVQQPVQPDPPAAHGAPVPPLIPLVIVIPCPGGGTGPENPPPGPGGKRGTKRKTPRAWKNTRGIKKLSPSESTRSGILTETLPTREEQDQDLEAALAEWKEECKKKRRKSGSAKDLGGGDE